MIQSIDPQLSRETERLHRLNTTIKQLQQLHDCGSVESGNLMCKETTRNLIRQGYAGTTGGSASSLSKIFITMKGQEFLSSVYELVQLPWD